MKLYIRTRYGKEYHILENGNIQRLDGMNTANDDWKMLGIVHTKRTRDFIPLEQLQNTQILGALPRTFKNGNPQWTVVDMDHGTKRIWGNTVYHGIAIIQGENSK